MGFLGNRRYDTTVKVENVEILEGGNIIINQGDIVITDGVTINGQDVSTVVGPSASSSLWEGGGGTGSIVMINQANPNTATGEFSFAIGKGSLAQGAQSFASGIISIASGIASHAEGFNTLASGQASHAEGSFTTASGDFSHAEGYNTTASGVGSHTEGNSTVASGDASHAEGLITFASGYLAHAEGFNTLASGYAAHAEGNGTVASGDYSHSSGFNTHAQTYAETVIGSYNESIGGSATGFVASDPVFRIGNGVIGSPSDAFRVYKNAAVYFKPVATTSITTPIQGMMIFDTLTTKMVVYDGTAWQPLW